MAKKTSATPGKGTPEQKDEARKERQAEEESERLSRLPPEERK